VLTLLKGVQADSVSVNMNLSEKVTIFYTAVVVTSMKVG